MPGIFISYRRDDKTAAAVARSLYDRLAEHFGKGHIFMDIDTLKAGTDFVEVIDKTVDQCDTLIAMIGDEWLDVSDEQGNRRLDSPEDWVRLEIATALRRDIQVIPALVYGAAMPRSKDLPRPLKKLARRQAAEITHKNFQHDVDRLLKDLPDHDRSKTKAGGEGSETDAPSKPEKPVVESVPLSTDGPDIVFDKQTGPMWTRDDNGEDIDWHGANEHAQNLELAGYSDWRLPTIDELEGIYDPNNVTGKWKGRDIHIVEGFQLTAPFIWSATKEGSDSAWDFGFTDGRRIHYSLDNPYDSRALCVRRSGD